MPALVQTKDLSRCTGGSCRRSGKGCTIRFARQAGPSAFLFRANARVQTNVYHVATKIFDGGQLWFKPPRHPDSALL